MNNNGLIVPNINPQPETIMIECSAQNSSQTTDNYDEWEVAIPPVKLEQGDEISVNQSFLEARGTSTEILEFSSRGANQNNKQTIYYDYYSCDDGTSDKNKGKDWINYGTNNTTPDSRYATAKTYKPCKAIRYDRLFEETTFNADGNAFTRKLDNGTTNSVVSTTSLNPFVANAFNISPREDYLVGGVFNSPDSIKELNDPADKHLGDINTHDLTENARYLRLTDACINLDAFEYWEIAEEDPAVVGLNSMVWIRVPYAEGLEGTGKGGNVLAQFPIGTTIQLGYMPKRRQFSYYNTATNDHTDTAYNINMLEHTEGRLNGIMGHYFVSEMGEGVFADDPTGVGGITNPFGWTGTPCFQIGIRQFSATNVPNIACPNITKASASSLAGSTKVYGTSTSHNCKFVNPYTTLSKSDLKDGTHTATTAIPVCLMLRKSPFYTGSQIASTSFNLFDDIRLLPSCKVAYGDNTRNITDAQLYDLYPKQEVATPGANKPEANANAELDIYVGVYHFNNLLKQYHFTNLPQDPTTQFTRLTERSIGKLVNYWTANKEVGRAYNPLKHALNANLTGTDAFVELTFTANPDQFAKQYLASNTIAVLNYNVANEEVVYLGSAYDLTNTAGSTWTYKVEIIARNITSNMNIYSPAPDQFYFDATNPLGWINGGGNVPTTKTTSNYVEWYDFEEGKCADFKIDPVALKQYLPTGIPILKKNGYLGANEPSLNDPKQYDTDILESWKYGGNFILYRNTTRVGYEDFLPDSGWAEDPTESATITKCRARLGSSKGCWTFNLSEAVPLTTAQFNAGNRGTTLTDISNQITASSNSPNAYAGSASVKGQPYGEINQNVMTWNMKFDYELSRNFTDIDGYSKTYCNNLYVFTPDASDSLIASTNTNSLKHISLQGVDLLCGYVPLINKITLETPKDYLTPDDLSNYWTEELHKLTDIVNLYDGTTIPNSAKRGVLQNPLLQPIYGSWGLGNFPSATGLLTRDLITFPHTNGYALGSVVFIDGHEQASDWGGTFDNNKDITSYIYPRTPNNLITLWDTATLKKLPTWVVVRNATTWTNTTYSTASRDNITITYNATTGYTYPTATSGLSNNTTLSNDAPNTASPAISKVNLSYGAGNTSATNQAEPKYSSAQYDGYDLWTMDADYPFKTSPATQAQREDPIYRETQDYPLSFFKDQKYNNYLKFSQYLGTDNMTLSYNTLVSAFEFQFLHQPYSTSYQLVEGQAEGGDNAIRIFDNIPSEVNNWERYGGVNVRNWVAPNVSRGYFTEAEVDTPPSWTNGAYPNGISPETTLEKIGLAFMEKLGFNKTQLTTTNVKALEGIGLMPHLQNLYVYEPNGTTGADPDIADAIINTSISAEDNPNSEAHGGKGQLIFYPSSADTTQKSLRHEKDSAGAQAPLGVRYDYSYTNYGQRGGLKTTNHNKAYGYPNITGSPLVKDLSTFPKTLNPDGEQRSGYTIEIGSSPIRATNLPVKLTDGYYYIICPNLIDDPQFYITANNGSVIPAIAIISKTYVSGDFYTSFQSPITFYCKKPKIISSIKVQIRNSSMGIPSNLGKNSSVIFSIKRFNPKPIEPGLTTSQQQSLDYKALNKQQSSGKTHINKVLNLMTDIFGLDQDLLVPNQAPTTNDPNWIDIGEGDRQPPVNPEMADADNNSSEYYGQLLDRINNTDLASMSRQERDTFFSQNPMGIGLKAEMTAVLQERQAQINAESQGDPVQLLVEEIDRENIRNAGRGLSGRQMIEELGQSPVQVGRREKGIDYTSVPRGGEVAEARGGARPKLEKEASKDTGMGTSVAPTTAPTETQEEED